MLNKREKEAIRQIENLIIEVKGTSNHDESRLCSINDALFELRRGSVAEVERAILIMAYNDKKREV